MKMFKTIADITKEHIENRSQLLKLAVTDMKKQYSGSVLGAFWAFVKPAITIFVFWFAFSVGLRHGADKNGYPFFLWLIAGMIPWFYMRDTFTGGTGGIRKYKYLVTKIKFPVSTIPTFLSISNLISHIVLLVVMIIIFMLFGYMPTIYYLELPIYMAAMFLFFTAWSLFASMLGTISKDFVNLVRSLVQALFWMSGIIYDASTIENVWIRTVLNFNPVTLIANGYRNVFIYGRWFWETPGEVRNFVIVYVIMCIFAALMYKKTRKDIPDML